MCVMVRMLRIIAQSPCQVEPQALPWRCLQSPPRLLCLACRAGNMRIRNPLDVDRQQMGEPYSIEVLPSNCRQDVYAFRGHKP